MQISHQISDGFVFGGLSLASFTHSLDRLATRLMVSRQTVCDLLREEISVNAEMANRLARTVGGWS